MKCYYAEHEFKLTCEAASAAHKGQPVRLKLRFTSDEVRALVACVASLMRANCGQTSATGEPLLLQFTQQCITAYAERVGIDRSESSLRKYRITCKHLQGYITQCRQTADVPLKAVNAEFFNGFARYLIHTMAFRAQTARLYLSALRHFCRMAMRKGLLTSCVWQGAELPRVEKRHFALTRNELDQLSALDVHGTRALVRNLFVLSAHTGLAYIDLKHLTPQHIERDNCGAWLTMPRHKTGQQAVVRLTTATLALLDKLPKLQPCAAGWLQVPDNRTINRHLHVMGHTLHLRQRLHLHVARHTFATLMLQRGVSLESVSTMLGHARVATTQRYAEVTRQKILHELGQTQRTD